MDKNSLANMLQNLSKALAGLKQPAMPPVAEPPKEPNVQPQLELAPRPATPAVDGKGKDDKEDKKDDQDDKDDKAVAELDDAIAQQPREIKVDFSDLIADPKQRRVAMERIQAASRAGPYSR